MTILYVAAQRVTILVTCIFHKKLAVHHDNASLLLYINWNPIPLGRKTTHTIQGVHK